MYPYKLGPAVGCTGPRSLFGKSGEDEFNLPKSKTFKNCFFKIQDENVVNTSEDQEVSMNTFYNKSDSTIILDFGIGGFGFVDVFGRGVLEMDCRK